MPPTVDPNAEPDDSGVAGSNGIVLALGERKDGQQRFEMVVSAECRFFAGHFPDHPLLPAAAILSIVSEAAARISEGVHPRGFHRARFLAPIEPATAVDLVFILGSNGRPVSFELGGDQQLHADGRLVYE